MLVIILKRCLLISLFINIYISVVGQDRTDTTVPIFFEKAYLHTDRNVYGQGEDIWFKAYVANAQNNTPINYSHNLYVELIGPEARMVTRETIRLDNGTGNGDFKLKDTIPAGKYRLRAYTNWMRNFGDNFVFEKNITILNISTATLADSKTSAAKNKVLNKSANPNPAATQPTPAVRFFPEGGSLIEGISSIVAVKAEDANGKGIPVKGAIISLSGDTVSHFNCDSLGMGLLALLPVKGQTYRAVIQPNNYQMQPGYLTFALPLAVGKGLTLQVKQTDSVIHAVINSSDPLISNAVNLVIKHGGKTQLNKPLQLQNLQTAVKIPTATLPEGISVITLYNTQGKPECERLVYIHHAANKNALSLTTNKKTYQPKEQVTIHIHTQPNARLSLAAVDATTVPIQPENILTYFNLQSEVKGKIENPNRYFDTTNVNRFKQLDQLLLTQGWRDFVWRRLEDTTLKLSYEPEQGITITGRVRKVGADKGLLDISVNMRAPNAEGQKQFLVITDSAGRFAIYGANFYGYQYISFTSRKNINNDGESKGKSGGFIQVDSLLRDPIAVKPVLAYFATDTSWRTSKQADAAIEQIIRSLKLKKDHILKEVIIKSNTSRLVTKLPPELHTITLNEQKEYGNLGQYLLYMIEGSRLSTYPCSGCWVDTSARVPILEQMGKKENIIISGKYIDGSKLTCVCQNLYLNIPMSDVLKVTINRSEDVFGKHISVSVMLRPNVLNTKDYFDNTVADMVGYYKAREFYKPKLEKPDDIDPRTNTIHWEPNITTNEKGEAMVSFYNTAQAGKMRLVAEGITPNGTPLTSTAVYEVK